MKQQKWKLMTSLGKRKKDKTSNDQKQSLEGIPKINKQREGKQLKKKKVIWFCKENIIT